jgi:hypothetical protein
MQDEIFPDKEHFGRIFRNNAKMSAMRITQIEAVMKKSSKKYHRHTNISATRRKNKS